MSDRKKLGRPKLPEGEGRDFVLSLRITPAENAVIEAAATKAGTCKATFALQAIMARVKRPETWQGTFGHLFE